MYCNMLKMNNVNLAKSSKMNIYSKTAVDI